MKNPLKTSDRSVRVLLGVIAGLLAANLLWSMQSLSPRQAYAAGIPDSGAQLQSIIEELQGLNKKTDKIESLMESGKMQVVVETKDKEK